MSKELPRGIYGTCDWGSCDKPANHLRQNENTTQLLPVCDEHLVEGMTECVIPFPPSDAHSFEAWANEVERRIVALEGNWQPATPAAESDSGEVERLRTELAAARAERDWARLLARAVLGCSISTYEVADQTIAIYSESEMIWAEWEGFGESDKETTLPKETPELRAKIEAVIASGSSVDSAQDVRIKFAAVAARAEKAEAELESERAYAQGLREQLKGAGRE